MTQKERIRKYLDEHGSISQKEANTISVGRLSARIGEMIQEGEAIICEMERGKNQYQQPTRYARYRRA